MTQTQVLQVQKEQLTRIQGAILLAQERLQDYQQHSAFRRREEIALAEHLQQAGVCAERLLARLRQAEELREFIGAEHDNMRTPRR